MNSKHTRRISVAREAEGVVMSTVLYSDEYSEYSE
jgi:hypothetical protein